MCTQCGGIFVDVADIKEIQLPRLLASLGRDSWRNQPECIGNRDMGCSICRSRCPLRRECSRLSPPGDSGYFSVLGMDDVVGKQTRPTPHVWLDGLDGDIKKEAIGEKWLRHWIRYFRTLYFVTVSPSLFFAGAFSKWSNGIHAKLRTLSPGRFFAYHVSFISILGLAVRLLLPGQNVWYLDWTTVLGLFKGMTFEILLHIAIMYVPGAVVVFFLRHATRKTYQFRRVDLTGKPFGSAITMPNVLRAIAYTSGFESPAIVGVELLFYPILEPMNLTAFHAPSLVYGYILCTVSKVTVLMMYLPISLSYSCKVPWKPAFHSGFCILMMPLMISAILRPVRLFL